MDERLTELGGSGGEWDWGPAKTGGVDQTLRLEVFGDLHQFGGLEGKLLDAQQARVAIGAAVS